MLKFVEVKKTYSGKAGEIAALDGLSFDIQSGESVALIGPSGCGKSTALLLAAGLLNIDEGTICINNSPVVKPRIKTGLILQDYGLLPWKTVYENAALGLLMRKVLRHELKERTQQVLEQVGLLSFANSYPRELSGGMRQRLALARVLVLDLDIMLMDEPLSALDLELREGLQDLLLKLWKARGYAQLIVTHSIDEAVYLGQRILVMSQRPGTIVAELANPMAGSKAYRSKTEFFAMSNKVREALLLAGEHHGS